MADLIQVRGLRVLGCHGVLEFERKVAQPFEIDLDLEVNLRRAGESDELTDTVSYAEIVADVKAVVESESHQLIERLADRIAHTVLSHDHVTGVEVTLKKPHAAVDAQIDYAAVRIRRP